MNILEKKYVFNKDLIFRDNGSITLLLDVQSGSFYELNPTAQRIFYMCKDELPFNKIIDELVIEYDVERQIIIEDVKELISRFINNNVIGIG